jgi:5-formyltetrahydrofolate cyclo-ligase
LPHDFRVNFIVTPKQIIACGPPKRPHGLSWETLSNETIAAIPALAAHRSTQKR